MSRGGKAALITGGIALALLLIVPLTLLGLNRYHYYGNWGWRYMGPGMMYGYGGGWFMGIFMIVFWGLFIWGAIALVRYLSRTRQYDSPGNTALEILKKRYAQGEIDKQEYEDKKKDLI